jgi:hypothetical protein
MARLNLDFGDLNTYLNLVKSEVAEKAVEDITTQLKIRGPYWTGEFEEAWEVTDGSPIPADIPASGTKEDRLAAGPQPRQVTKLRAGVDFPSAPKKGPVNYAIGNRMEYRDIAQDLTAGRIKGGGNETADQDWYVNYVQGGGLATTIQLSTGKTTQDPKIKNFRGKIGK